MKLVTNHQFRNILSSSDLTPKELEEFDYLPQGQGAFMRYKGLVYDLGTFIKTQSEALSEWDALHSDTAFSGIVIKVSPDGDAVKVGAVFS